MTRIVRISPRRWFYWGHEDLYPGEHCGAFEQFWWLEDSPPFRNAKGWRMKEDPFTAFHFGFAKSEKKSLVQRDLDHFTPLDIAEWVAPLGEGDGPVRR